MNVTPSTAFLHPAVLHNRGRRRSSVASTGSHHGLHAAKSALRPLRFDLVGNGQSAHDRESARSLAMGIPPPLSGRFSSNESKLLRETYLHRLDVLDTVRGIERVLLDISVQVPPSDLKAALALAGVQHDALGTLAHVLTENEFYALVSLLSIAAKEEPTLEDQEREELIDVLLQIQGAEANVTPRPASVSALEQMRAKHDPAEITAARVALPALQGVLKSFALTSDVSVATGLKPQVPPSSPYVTSPVSNAKNAPPPPPPPPPTLGIYDLAMTLSASEEVQEIRRKEKEAAAIEAKRLHEERHVVMPNAQPGGAFANYHANREKSLRRKAAKLNVDAMVNGQSMNRKPTRGSSMKSDVLSRKATLAQQSMMKLRRGISSLSQHDPAASNSTAGDLLRVNTHRSTAASSDGDSARASVKLPSLRPTESSSAPELSPEFGMAMEPTGTFEMTKDEEMVLHFGDLPSYDSVIRSRSVGLYGAKRRSPRPWHVPKPVTPDPETAAQQLREQKKRIRAARMLQRAKIGITDAELDEELRRRKLGPYKDGAVEATERGSVGPTPRSAVPPQLPTLTRVGSCLPPKTLTSNGSFDQHSASDELTSARSQLRSFRADVSGVMDPAGLSSRREIVANLFTNAATPERRAVIDRWLATERM